MTNQIKDTVRLEEQDYALLGRSSRTLFDPEEHGLEPLPLTSANYRGFSCRYAIRENCLFLDKVNAHVFLEGRRTENAPVLFGKTAEVSWMDDRLRAGGGHLR